MVNSPGHEIADEIPWSDQLTAYDEAHFDVYLRLLDATADGATEDDMAMTVLGIDPATEARRAKIAVRSHLRRAQWMTETGYRQLLASDE